MRLRLLIRAYLIGRKVIGQKYVVPGAISDLGIAIVCVESSSWQFNDVSPRGRVLVRTRVREMRYV